MGDRVERLLEWWRLPREKTPHRAPPCEELDPPYDIKLVFFVQKITFYSYENQQKLLSQELHFLTPVCTKSFVYLGFAPDPTG